MRNKAGDRPQFEPLQGVHLGWHHSQSVTKENVWRKMIEREMLITNNHLQYIFPNTWFIHRVLSTF